MLRVFKVRLLIVLWLIMFAFSLGRFINPAIAQAPDNDDPNRPTDPYACLGYEMAKYMNTILDAIAELGLSNIRLLSPAFNLTSAVEPAIFSAMVAAGARFDDLWGFAGNTYSYGGVGAMDYYRSNGWEAAFGNKPVIFTEFGAFTNAYPDGAGRSQMLQDLRNQFRDAANSGVVGINFFAAYEGSPVNPEFIDRHRLSDAEIRFIIQDYESYGGLNQGLWLGESGNIQAAAASFGMGWAVEILDSHSAGTAAAAAIREGAETVFRLCVGSSCSFSDPQNLISFLTQLNGLAGGPVYIIGGPNEPASEPWVGGDVCGFFDKLGIGYDEGGGVPWLPDDPPARRPPPDLPVPPTPCNETRNPEFHSLRPYPGSPCNTTPYTQVEMCAERFTAREVFQALPGNANFCQAISETMQRCSFTVNSVLDVSVDAGWTRLPIMGNTELVPNMLSGENSIPNATRMSEYASWYLNGVTSRAEEEDEFVHNPLMIPPLTPQQRNNRINEVINFSGPIKKLYPYVVQFNEVNWLGPIINPGNPFLAQGERELQKSDARAGNIRHNQIVVCTSSASPNFPIPCYNSNRTEFRNRMLDSQLDFLWANQTNPAFSFIPMSSTEDLFGQLRVQYRGSGGSVSYSSVNADIPNGGNILSFPHMEEVDQLANILQKTFTSSEFINYFTRTWDNITKGEVPIVPESEGGLGYALVNRAQLQNDNCTVERTKKNPGDLLYGNTPVLNYANNSSQQGSISYTANFTCEFPIPIPDPVCVSNCITNLQLGMAVCQNICTPEVAPCTQFAEFYMDTDSVTPLAFDVWDRLVAGNFSVFRRMLPRVSSTGPIRNILDIPAEDQIRYDAENLQFSGAQWVGAGALAGDPANRKSGVNVDIYFPHIGSVHEYFLQGIQCAIRPRGMCANSSFSGNINPTQPLPPTGSEKETEAIQHLYQPSCNGSMCWEYIVDRSVAQARCDGLYFNPYVAIAISLNESGGLVSTQFDGGNVKHFGCDPFGALGIGITPIEKFQCMINTFTNDCGKSDEVALGEYGYIPEHNLSNLVSLLGLNVGVQPSGYAFDLWVNQATAQSYAESLRNTLPGQQTLWYNYYEGYIKSYN